jgi:hypothetical protein
LQNLLVDPDVIAVVVRDGENYVDLGGLGIAFDRSPGWEKDAGSRHDRQIGNSVEGRALCMSRFPSLSL